MNPPKLPGRLLEWFYGAAVSEDLLGDLDELFFLSLEKRGKYVAAIYYWAQAFRLCFSYTVIKRKRDHATTQQRNRPMLMFNYFKISYRHLMNNRTFSALNIIGLSLGMSIALLALATFIELHQFDTNHPHAKHIYRINTVLHQQGDQKAYASAPPALAALYKNVPGIRNSVSINKGFNPQVRTAGAPISLRGYVTEPAFLDLFSFQLLEGNAQALLAPGQVIITYELSQKLFGGKPALNQMIQTENWGTLQIMGILAPFPKHTHFFFDILIGPSNRPGVTSSGQWTSFEGNYFYFDSEVPITTLQRTLSDLGRNGDPFFADNQQQANYKLQSITEINPGPSLLDGLGFVMNMKSLYLFFGIAILVLIPASMNYINMAIANSLKRAKEIGIRKVLGVHSNQIIKQFLVETVLICWLAVGLGLLLFTLIRQEFISTLVGGYAFSLQLTWELLISFLLFGTVTGVLTGLIPAIIFSRAIPIEAIRKTLNTKKVSISGMRKTLMVFQFVITLVLMSSIGVLTKQYQHALTYDLGFHKENILVVPVDPSHNHLLKQAFTSLADVNQVSFSSSLPGTPLGQSLPIYGKDHFDSLEIKVIYVDDDFVTHMGLQLVAGHNQINNTQIDQVLINEKLRQLLNNLDPTWEDHRILQLGKADKVEVIGTIKDYNHEPIRNEIEPLIIRRNLEKTAYALVSITTQDLHQTLESLEYHWNLIYPTQSFRSSFLDDEIEKAYFYFRSALKIFGTLAIMAISISCLGLLGMVVYSTENRTKEVAIRKILGANSLNLLSALAGLFFKLWLIALPIAIPVSYFFYDQLFVQTYKFKGEVGLWEILLSTLVTISIGALAILWQTQRVMKTNPAVNLRNE